MWNPSLADTLGGQDYHVSKIRIQVLQHLIRVKTQNWQDNLNRYTNEHTTAKTHPVETLKPVRQKKEIAKINQLLAMFI